MHLVKGLGKSFPEPHHFALHFPFQLVSMPFSSPLSTFLIHFSLHCPVNSPLYSGLHPHWRDHSSFHSDTIYLLRALHSPLHPPVYTPPPTPFPPHSPSHCPPLSTALSPHTFPFHPIPFCNGATNVVPAFSTNVQEPGQARGWRVSLSHSNHTVVRDEDTTRYEHGEPRAHACNSGHVLHVVQTRGSKSGDKYAPRGLIPITFHTQQRCDSLALMKLSHARQKQCFPAPSRTAPCPLTVCTFDTRRSYDGPQATTLIRKWCPSERLEMLSNTCGRFADTCAISFVGHGIPDHNTENRIPSGEHAAIGSCMKEPSKTMLLESSAPES